MNIGRLHFQVLSFSINGIFLANNRMRMRGVLLLFAAVAAAVQVELLPYDPTAAPGAVVVEGKARFTVLTDRVIR